MNKILINKKKKGTCLLHLIRSSWVVFLSDNDEFRVTKTVSRRIPRQQRNSAVLEMSQMFICLVDLMNIHEDDLHISLFIYPAGLFRRFDFPYLNPGDFGCGLC